MNPPKSQLAALRPVLLVIDMQNDFVQEGAPVQVPGIQVMVPKLRSFIDRCRSAGLAIIYTRHTFDPLANPIEAELFPKLTRAGLRRGTSGHEIVEELAPRHADTVIDKTRYDAFYQTNLEQLLRERGTRNLLISGTMTEVCCESTARSAMYRDFHVWFLSDLTFTADQTAHTATLEVIASHFGRVIKASDCQI